MSETEGTDPTTAERWKFNPEQLDRTVLAIPLLHDLKAEKEHKKERELHPVVMEINLEHPAPRDETREIAEELVQEAMAKRRAGYKQQRLKQITSPQYLYAVLWGDTIRAIVDENEKRGRPIYRIWPDFEIGAL
jgi:hypothetical protein